MATAPSIYRIILAISACLGFCGFGCLHPSVTAEESAKDLVIHESVYEQGPVLAVSNDFSSQGIVRPNRAELSSFVFGIERPLDVLIPVFSIEYLLSEYLPETQNAETSALKNKDPPSLTAGTRVFLPLS